MNELTLQKRLHKFLSDPSKIFWTKSNKRLQFLSPGRLNREVGPDFVDIAILLDGIIIIGDAEFHKKSSEWLHHRHSKDENFRNVCLHIVLEDDYLSNENFELLVINKEDLLNFDLDFGKTQDLSSDIIDELQNYALIRLLRKTSEARLVFDNTTPKQAFEIVFKNFLYRYINRRHRPYFSKVNINDFLAKVVSSEFFQFYEKILNGIDFVIPESLFTLMKNKIDTEGNHLRRELIMNCLLPLCIAISNDRARMSLFSWFWSTPAITTYGSLTRKFPSLPQNFIWQQQGMLEILTNFYRITSTLSASIQQFKIGEVLNFFHLGNPSF